MKWPGLMSNVAPHDIPAGGAQVQTNLMSLNPGKLVVRKGMRVFTSGSSGYFLSLFRWNVDEKQYIAAHSQNTIKLFDGANWRVGETSVDANKRSTFAQSRIGSLIRVNGVARGTIRTAASIKLLENGKTWRLGITAPQAAPTITWPGPGGSAYKGSTYYFGYRYLDADGFCSDLSPLASKTTGGNVAGFGWTMARSDELATDGLTRRITKIELYRSLADDPSAVYLVATIDNPSGTDAVHSEYAVADTTLVGYACLPILYDDGSLCARRFGLPPSDAAVVVPFQGRHFYGVQATPDAATRNRVYYSEPDLPEAVPVEQNCLILTDEASDPDDLTAMFARGSVLYLGMRRHLYGLTFGSDPRLDGAVHLLRARGILNQRAFALYRDAVYLLDDTGPWRMGGEGDEDFDAPVRNYWSDGLIDYAKSETFFVGVEPFEQVVRYYVILTSDKGHEYPKRALCYSIRTGSWWMETYPVYFFSACTAVHNGRARTMVGITGNLMLVSEGLSDQEVYTGANIPIPYSYRSGKVALPEGDEGSSRGAGRGERIPDRALRVVYDPIDTPGSEQVTFRLYYDHDASPIGFWGGTISNRWSVAHNAAGIILDLRKAASAWASAPGFERIRLPGRTDGLVPTHRYLTMEFEGSQSANPHVFHEIAMEQPD